MALPRHKAIVAGLALTLTLGTAAGPALATLSEESTTTDTDPNGVGLPLPADYDKADFYEGTEGATTFAMARTGSRLAAVSLSDEMKYFTKFESNCNYDQGFSYGDGYNALGYYQFDRRYSLMPFIQQVYDYNPTKYAMFKSSLEHKDTLSSSSYKTYDSTTRQLTALAQDLNDAWHAAYAADPAEFSALQDSYAYNSYYLPVQSILLNKFGVDIRNRADCVKGLVWGMCNLFGQGGVQNYLRDANLSNDMTDRELVTALCDTVVERVTYYCSSQPQYWAGWQNRYRNEKKICLEYIAEDEAQQNPGTGNGGAAGDGSNAGTDTDSGTDSDSGSDAGTDNGGDAGSNDNGATDGSGSDNGASGDTDSGSDGSGSDSGTSGDDQQVTPPSTVTPSTPDASDPSDGGDATNPDDGSNGSTGDSSTPDGGAGNGSTGSDGSDTGSSDSGDDATDGTGSTTGDGSSSGTGATDDDASQGTDDTKGTSQDDDTSKSDGTSGSEDDGAAAKNKKTSNDKKGSGANGKKDGLPQTGDIAALVMTGAAGLAVAGGSFLSLGKKEREREE